MKLFVFLSVIVIANLPKKNKYVILYDQHIINTPIPYSQEAFWSDSMYFDTVIVSGEEIIPRLELKIGNFKKLDQKSKAYYTFSVKHAIVRYENDIAVDTLYTNSSFRYWKIKEELFEDKERFFYQKFSDLTIVQTN